MTTYFVNGHQVVKLDYSNTNYYYNTKYGTNNGIPLDNVNNQTSNTRSWEIYAYSKDIPLLNNSYTSGKFLTPETAEKSGSTLKLDPSKFYYIGGGTWTINTASAVVLADAANGNKNPNGLYVQNGTSDDKGSDGMNFRVNVVNYDMTTDLKDLTAFINLPVKGYNNTTTNFFLSGPVDVPDGTVLYSTSSTDLPSGVGTKTPSTDNFLTKEQVEAKIASGEMSWADVKSIAVKYDTVKANSATKDIYIHGTDPDITKDAGKRVQLSWGLYGGNDMPPLVKKNASTIVISGSSTINTRLHYVDPEGKDQYVDVPTMSKTYKDNSDTMRDSDFNEKNIPASLIPQGYELVLQNENGKAVAVKSIIDNGGKTWVTDAKDGSAQFGKLVLYNFDGDTVQFELTPKIDKATQTVKRTVHFVSDGDNPQKLADDVYETAKITELTNEVTGEKQYSATITAGGVTTDAPVVVGQDGQISISFPATTIPEVNKYYVVDSTKSEAGAISPKFTFTKDGELPIVNTVKYAPVKQKLQVKVYDDDADDHNQALDTTKTRATVDFIGNSETDFPTADLQTNLEKLKQYYESENYIVRTLPVATGKFDNTPNGSGSDTQIQVLEVHLTHAKVVKTEYAKAVRNITYEGAGEQTPATKSDTFDNTFSRTITTDKVTKKVTISGWTGSYIFDSVNSPSVEGYHPDKASAGNIKATADSLNAADESTLAELLKTGVVVSDHVTYSPDKQEVKIRVYDDTTGRELSPETDIKEQGKDVEINLSGTSNEIIPTEFGNNIDLLKKHYQSKGYKFISHTLVPQHFDHTSNGSSETDSNPQYINIHLEHDLSLEKETKTVTRTINYYDQDKKQLINDANNKVTEKQTVVQEVDFARYAVRDKVTNQIIGYATPDQVTVNGDDAQLIQENGYTHVTGEASDARASFAVTSADSKFAGQINYDLSKYGYEAPTTINGDSFAQVAELTPLPTDANSIVNVYYREKVVTVTVDDPPTVGKKVPGTDAEFPPNEWIKDNATSTSTRTIHYVYDDNTFANGFDVSGKAVPGLNDIIQKVNFAQSAKINLVTGDVSYQGDWNAISSTTTNQQGEEVPNQENGNYAKVISPSSKNGYPELKGYTAHQEVVDASQATHGVDGGQVLVKYTANDSLVQIEYVDQDTGLALKVDTKNGKSGEKFDYSTTNTIADYEKSGYELVHDGFTENDGNLNNKTFDSYDDVPDSQRPETINQKWKVTLKHKKITVTNDDPKDPDGKITTDKGYDHNYPTGVSETDLNNTVRRNISFIYTDKPEGSNQAFPTETQEVAYKRQATIDLVKLANGDSDAVSYSNWKPKEAGKESFDSYQVKPIKGYVANYELVPSADVHKDQDGKAENGQDVVVKYSPVGKIIPIDKDGNEFPNAPTPEYNNDPTDPTKTTTTDVPEIPGYHAEVPNVTPDNPLEDTKVVYVKNTQVIDLVYVDTKTNTTLTTQNDVAHGDSGSTIPTSVTDTLNSTIQSYLDKGYVIDPYKVSGTVPDTFDFSDQTADGADKEHQVVTIYLTHGTVTVTGNDPKTPGEPINPKDPNGSKYPPEAGKDNLVISSQNIIHYYDEAGNKILDDKVNTDDSTLTRTVTIDKVTGDVISTGNWTGGKEYENVNTPVVNGYYTDRVSAGASTVTPADANSGRVHNGVITNETTVIYHPMGHIIPIDKSGKKIPGAETPIFNNDPNDPTKGSTTNSPIIPGYHLETPSDSAITPDEPGKDRPVVYVADTQELKVQVFDLDGDTPDEPLKTDKTGATVDFTGDSFTNFPSDVATNVDSLIKYYTDRGYLIKTKPSDEELSGKFDGDKTQTQYLKLQLVHDKATVSGEDENTPAPDTPINENDPDGVKYPSDVSKDNLVISSEVIIHYEGAGEKTPKDVIRTVDKTLTRTVTIDKVTGKVTNTSDWTGGKEYENVNTPVVSGYYVDKASASAGASTVTPADADPNSGRVHNGVITNETTVIYHPMGHIIPIDKSGKKIPGAETPIFNNDPKDPTKASTTNSPIIPGYHLETPSDSAITPDEPGKDRPVVYVADTQELKVQVFDLDGDTPDEPLKTDKTGATVDFTGDSFTNFPSDVATNVDSLIKYYTDRGYLIKTKPSDEELSGKFDGDKTQTQYLKLQLVHDKATVSGEDENTPAPDTPINENDPDGVKYPSDVSKDNLVISSEVIIHYEGAGEKTPKDVIRTVDKTLTRTVTIDKVTGKVTNTSDWTGGKEYENVNTPVVSGYYVDKASASAGASTVTPADADPNSGRVHNGVITNETTVIYHPMGHIIPIDKSGKKIPGAETPIFNNDPKDPTKASTTNSPIIPGYHLETPSDSAITPDEPGKDRPVVYVADTQELKVQVFDLDGDTPDEPLKTDKTGATVDFTGDSFTNFPSDVATNVDSLIKYYTDRGYLIKTKPSDEELSGKFDGDKTQTQYLKLQLVHDKATVSGEDENTPAPDTPINENDPDGVKYPSDVSKDNLVISSEVIIHYEGAGEKTPKDVIRTVDKTLTRTVTIDKVTGKVTNTSDWTGGKEYENVNTPVVNGYYTDRVSAGASTVTPADANSGRVHNGVITNETTVIYHPMGHIIPIDKSGKKIPGAETPIFNNDPNDPTKGSTTNSPIIPGYHLETPSDSAITPDEPGKDRPVVYVADTQELKVQVFDLDGDTPDEPLKTDKTGATVDFTGDSFTNFPSDVATNVDSLIKYYTDRGYLIKTKPSDEELSGKFDGDKTQTQYLKLQLVHDKATVSGEDENTPAPDTPINENDPDGVKYPSDVSKDNLVISSEVIIHYEGAGEKTPKDVIRTVDKTLTRTVTIDKVTGKVTNTSDWSSNTTEYESVLTPQIQGYTSDKVQVDKVSITKDNAGEAKNGKITYTFNVVYTPDKQQLILKVHDEDTQSYLGDPVIFDGYSDQEVGNSSVDKLEELKKKYLDLGYEIVEIPQLDKNYDDTQNVGGEPDKEPQVFVLKVKHRIVPVTPDDPKTPDDIIPDSNQNYPGGLTETDLSRTITRTIVVNFPSGTSQEIKQVVTYTGTATVDAVTKEVKYSAWTTKNSDWPEQVAPTVPGYTPDKDKVDLTCVPADGNDVTVEINYTADPETDEPTTPVKPGETITPVTPTKPDKPTKPVKPTKPSKPEKPAKQTKPEVVKPVKETKGKQLYGSAQAKVDSKAARNVVDKNKANGTNDKKLPQTNSESDWQLSLLGVGVLALALLVLKKKRDDE